MSTLEQSLEVFSFSSLSEVTNESLKGAFRSKMKEEHPDHGGDGERFDALLSSFVFLKQILLRRTGGREASVLDSKEVQEARERQLERELLIDLDQALDDVQQREATEFLRVFNAQFEEARGDEKAEFIESSEPRGYAVWLQSAEPSGLFQADGPYGALTLAPPSISEREFHAAFEAHARAGKEPVTTLALHPDQMAVRVSCGGMALARASDTFTSDWLDRPEYTDLQDAYTRSTVIDQLPAFQDVERSFEAILKERDMVYETELDRDLAAIQAYEARCQAEEAEHKRRVAEYFRSTGSSQWALRDGAEAVAGAGAGGAGVDDGDEKEENTRSR